MTAAKEKAISEFGPSHQLRHRSTSVAFGAKRKLTYKADFMTAALNTNRGSDNCKMSSATLIAASRIAYSIQATTNMA
jgi:hypothetical protein